MASTHWPTFSLDESPHGTTGTLVTSSLRSAMSVIGSVAMSRPPTCRLSGRTALISRTAPPLPAMTWLFVTTYPSGEMMTPDPRLIDRWSWSPKSSPKK